MCRSVTVTPYLSGLVDKHRGSVAGGSHLDTNSMLTFLQPAFSFSSWAVAVAISVACSCFQFGVVGGRLQFLKGKGATDF